MPDTIAPKLLSALNRLGLAMRSARWGEAGATGLTPTQRQIMAHLAARASEDVRPSDIAEALGTSAQTASAAIATLAAKGLIHKTVDPSDRRATTLGLSSAGKRAAREAAQWPDEFLAIIDELDATEQAMFLRCLIKLIRRLQLDGRIPPQRLCVTCNHFRPHAHAGESQPHHCALIDRPLRDLDLRVDCAEHDPLDAQRAETLWRAFTAGG